MTSLNEGDWFYGVLLETCRDRHRSISRPRVRPVEELPCDSVEFRRALREQHPLGRRFRADVKVCRKHFPDGSPNGPVYFRADTDTIIRADDYTPDRMIFAVHRSGTISGRAYDWIELKQQNVDRVTSFSQLRRIAYQAAALMVPTERRERWGRERNELIGRYALARSHGICEGCVEPAPFLRRNNTPYLETHHIVSLASGGADHPTNVAAVCPNSHRRTEHSTDAFEFNAEIRKRVSAIEEGLGSVSF